jgi:N-acetylglucosamine-6-sulfatase
MDQGNFAVSEPRWTRRGLLHAAGGLANATSRRRRPNLVVILVDDLRFDAMGCAGHPWIRTPHIDRLARRGTRFANAFVTTSLCSPSRASILTGQYMHAHGVQDNFTKLPDALPTFPKLLRRAGYRSAFVGKWHMGDSQLIDGGHDSDAPQPGFDHWVSFGGQGVFFDPKFNINGKRRKLSGYTTDLLTEEAVRYIRAQNRSQPFCLYLSHKAVHSNHNAAPRHRSLYQDQAIAAPASAQVRVGKPDWLLRKRDEGRHGLRRLYAGMFDLPGLYREYARCLAAVDDSVGAVEAALEERGILRDTLVLFLGDNGFLMGEQGLVDKRTMHDPSIRIPLLAAWPGMVEQNATRDEMVLNLDVAPTLLQAAGVTVPPRMHGRSILDLARGPVADWRRDFVYEYFWDWEAAHTPGVLGLRSESHSYMEYQGIWDVNELYDMKQDPEQMKNLLGDARVGTEAGGWMERIGNPATKRLVREMRSRMVNILKGTGGAHLARGPV